MIKRWRRRWLFRRMFPNYKTYAEAQPADGDVVVLLDALSSRPFWVAEYDTSNQAFLAGGGWFEPKEIDYWSPVVQIGHPYTSNKDLVK